MVKLNFENHHYIVSVFFDISNKSTSEVLWKSHFNTTACLFSYFCMRSKPNTAWVFQIHSHTAMPPYHHSYAINTGDTSNYPTMHCWNAISHILVKFLLVFFFSVDMCVGNLENQPKIVETLWDILMSRKQSQYCGVCWIRWW